MSSSDGGPDTDGLTEIWRWLGPVGDASSGDISYCHQKQTPASNHTWSTDIYMFIWINVIFMMLYLQTIILFYARTCMYLLCIQNICIMLKRALILRKYISINCSDRWTISSLIICILNNVHVCLSKITVWKKADTFINKKNTNNPIK